MVYTSSCHHQRIRLLHAEAGGAADCLDLTRSAIQSIPGFPNRIMDVTTFAFHEELIPDPVFFTIPQLDSTLLATEGVRVLV